MCWRGRESARGEARQILSRGEIALLRIYCFKCNWVQPAPGERIHRSLLSGVVESRLLIRCDSHIPAAAESGGSGRGITAQTKPYNHLP